MSKSCLRALGGSTGKAIALLLSLIRCSRILPVLMLVLYGIMSTNGLECYKCGEYNEGVGSITPCFNYSEKHKHIYLKECMKKSDNYCVVSESSSYNTSNAIFTHSIKFVMISDE